MLVAQHLYKTYRTRLSTGKSRILGGGEWREIEAVQDLSLTIEPGQIVGLLGVNGAGKTTAIKMLTTLLSPTRGSIEIDGVDVVRNHTDAKQMLNLITGGERNIYWRLSGRENLEYFGRLYGIRGKDLDRRVEDVLQVVQLEDVKDVPVEKYSKGMKQRLQIARGLINDPRYVFLDEPTLGLDIVIARELRKHVRELATVHAKGVLLCTHYMFEADELCDYIYVMHRGRVIATGTPREIKQRCSVAVQCRFVVSSLGDELGRLLRQYSESNPDVQLNVDHAQGHIEALSKDDVSSRVLAMILRSDAGLISMSVGEPALEDALYQLVTES